MSYDKKLISLSSVDECVWKLVDVLNRTIELSIEIVPIKYALDRVMAEDVYAVLDKPCRDSSAVDGYALYSDDTIGASHYNPVELTIVGYHRPGKPVEECLTRGTAIRVHTGSFIPCGANAVVMDEDVVIKGDKILVSRPISPGSNILKRGEDFRKGDIVASKGSIVTPFIMASIAANGISSVKVYRKIRVSIISIGDEIVEPGSNCENCVKTYNSTTYLLSALMSRDRIFEIVYQGISPDNVDEVFDLINKIQSNTDIVITTGGTGISESDIIYDLVKRYGKWIFRGVKMRPGRPTSCSLINNIPIIHLSGFPVAAWAGYEAIVRPAIFRWLGVKGLERVIIYSRLKRRVPNNVGYRSFIRVSLERVNNEYLAEPYMLRGSGILSSLLRTEGYIVIPEDVEGYEKDSIVPVYLY
ncbi:MAG: molybdopterin molybdotransferase MoeA [Desulfurococcaceae archaeon]